MYSPLVLIAALFASFYTTKLVLASPVTADYAQEEAQPGGDTSQTHRTNRHSFSKPFATLNLDEGLNFQIGKAIFEKLWVFSPSSTTASDGLGPLYNARSCARCHRGNGRSADKTLLSDGPFLSQPISLLLRLSRPDDGSATAAKQLKYQGSIADPIYGAQLQTFAWPNGKTEGHIQVDYTFTETQLNGGEAITLRKPIFTINKLGYGPLHPSIRISPRLTPPIIGLGLVDAISKDDLLTLSDPHDADKDGISGRLSTVWNPITQSVTEGRFGWKASAATLAQQNLTALNTDIGINSYLYPNPYGDCTSEQTLCLEQANGNTGTQDSVEASNKVVNALNFFVEHLAVPVRYKAKEPEVLAGKKIFYKIGCTGCHQPSFTTSKTNNTKTSEKKIWPYSDFLLHDMGPQLADEIGVFNATGSEWRTPPLWGIGLTKAVGGGELYLHDGRAKSLLEAILWHGGEAKQAKQAVINMTPAERQQLITFMESL